MPQPSDPARDEPVTLAPLDFEEALRALLQVDPASEPVSDLETGDDPHSDRPEA